MIKGLKFLGSRVPIYYSFPSRHAIGYQFELDHFVDTVVGRSEPFVTEKMTLAVTKIATAAEEAAKSGEVELMIPPYNCPSITKSS